jgi:hypothetical protein
MDRMRGLRPGRNRPGAAGSAIALKNAAAI